MLKKKTRTLLFCFIQINFILFFKSTPNHALEIHIIATQEDMNDRFFKVEYRENLESYETNIELYFVWGNMIESENCILPYIDSQLGTYRIEGRKLIFLFLTSGPVEYGYFVYPTKGVFGSGFCNKDIGVLDLYNYLPYGLEKYDEIKFFFDVPENMPVYAPWEKTDSSNRVYKLIGDDVVFPDTHYVYNYSLAAWGNFTSQDSLVYDTHKLYLLGYENDTSNIFQLMKYSYDYFMKAYEEHLNFLPVNTIVTMLPDYGGGQGGDNYGSNRESPGGFYNPNWNGNEWEPVIDDQGYDNGYLNIAKNLDPLSVNGVHCIAHSILNPTYQGCGADYWFSEGVAVYYQIDMLYRIGIFDEELINKEFNEHLKYYQKEIVSKGIDRELYLAGREGWSNLIFWIAYKKGALMFYAFNKMIQDYTNKELSLIDFWEEYLIEMDKNRHLYNNWYDSYTITTKALTELTGKNIQKFFNLYVYEAGPLPLEMIGNEIVVHYDQPVVIYRDAPQRVFVPQNGSEILVKLEDNSSLSVTFIDGEVKHKYLSFKLIDNIQTFISNVKVFDNELCYIDIAIEDSQIGAEISYTYTESQLSANKIEPQNLKICIWYNGYWKILDTVIDEETNTITAYTDHFSLFAIVSDNEKWLSQYSLYPPDNLSVNYIPDDHGHKLELSWQLSPDEENGLVTHYRIYRSRSEELTEPLLLTKFNSIDSLIVYEEHYTVLIDSVTVGETLYIDEGVLLNGEQYYYWIQAVGISGESEKITAGILTVINADNLPNEFILKTPYPNPFNPTTTIEYSLPQNTQMTLTIYNVSGQTVMVLNDEYQQTGNYSVVWCATGMPSGIYYCTLKANEFTETKKMLLLK